MTTGTTLVVGGTGKTGRRVAERLAGRGRPIRMASRTTDPPARDFSDYVRETVPTRIWNDA